MEKSSDAFRTISEVADDLRLPQHVLRFWETRFTHIKPLKRAGGRRYYRPADVVLLRTIRQLLYDEGYTIKGVQRLLREQGARSLRNGDMPPPPEFAALAGAIPADEPPDTAEAVEDATLDALPLETAPPDIPDHDPLFELLAVIDECTRILDALRPKAG